MADFDVAIRRAITLEDEGRYGEAIAAYRAGLTIWPTSSDMKWRLSFLLLREGEYEEGWRLYESRPGVINGQIGRPKLSFPEWSGEPVRSLLIFPEQGLGDQIMFARFLPLLRLRGIEPILLSPPPLARLFSRLDISIVPAVGSVRLPACDAWALIGSLPHRLGCTLETLPPPLQLPSRPNGRGFGVSARGHAGHPNDANRSLPGELAADLLSLPEAVSLAPADTGATDLEDTREAIEQLSAVITVDTSTAHLAGSMGKPCHVLLPQVADWRWLKDRGDSPWYPSVQLYRQQTAGDWSVPLRQLKAALLAGGHTGVQPQSTDPGGGSALSPGRATDSAQR